MQTTKLSDPWVKFSSSPIEECKLFCFPYAGGDVYTYRNWKKELDPRLGIYAIQLPGRGAKFEEAPFRKMGTLLAYLAESLRPQLQGPYAFFGHSLGAWVAFELTRYLKENFATSPEKLFISSASAPHLRHADLSNYHKLSDDDLLQKVKSFGAIPKELLIHRDFLEMLIPTLRADMELIKNYHDCFDEEVSLLGIAAMQKKQRVECDLHLFGGEKDSLVPPCDLRAWEAYSLQKPSCDLFPGGHFYLKKENSSFFEKMNAYLIRN